MLIRSQITTLLQIFCELLLYSQVIFKSMKVADDTSKSNSECEWVELFDLITFKSWTRLARESVFVTIKVSMGTS